MKNDTIKNKLKIAFVLDDGFDSIDGVQRNILTLGQWFEEKGHSVKYLIGETKQNNVKNSVQLSKNLRVRYNGNVLSISLYSSKKKILEVLKEEKFDVVHIQMPYSPFMGAKVIKYAAKKSLIAGTFHILPYKKIHDVGNYLLGFWLKNNLKKIDITYSVSQPAAEFAKKTHGIESKILPNPIYINKFAPKKAIPNKNSKSIVFLGRLVPRKGCAELLKAIKYIDENKLINSDYTVHICGKGHEQQELEKFVRNNDLSKNVVFHGFVAEEEKIMYLQQADVAVFPAIKGESFGIVLIEAMAAKSKVVLAANNEGYTSVLGSIPEVMFDPKNSKQLAKLISEVVNSEDVSRKIHDKQQQLIKEFDINKIGNKLLSDYRAGLARKFS